jgi:ADP-ribose pyrophosphatase YjhB (NUDIX family)
MFISVRIDRSVIRVKAMLIAPNLEHTAHAVTLNAPTVENPRGFHRLIGGSVELGERHVDTIRREVDEELGATIRDLAFLTAAENIFTIDGVLGHEIVFLYSGRLEPAPPATGATLTESDGSTVPVVWRSLSGEREEVPLYPGSAEFWVVNLAHVSQQGGQSIRIRQNRE